jgi:hypothetical protein
VLSPHDAAKSPNMASSNKLLIVLIMITFFF